MLMFCKQIYLSLEIRSRIDVLRGLSFFNASHDTLIDKVGSVCTSEHENMKGW